MHFNVTYKGTVFCNSQTVLICAPSVATILLQLALVSLEIKLGLH